jgi:aminomethyltransferase
MLYPDGGIVDDLLVYMLPERYLLVVNASNQDKDYEWIMKNKRGSVDIKNTSDDYFQIALQGPLVMKIMNKIIRTDVKGLPFYWAKEEEIDGCKVVISRTGYTGEDGFEIYGNSELGVKVWDIIMEAGESIETSVIPCGLGARDILRLEMGYCLYGNDITKETTPLEAGLKWLVKMEKEDFIGKEALIKQKEEGITRKLVGMEFKGRAIPRHGYSIFKDSEVVGEVTSGCHSPTLGYPIAMGYINKPFNKEGTKLEIRIRDKIIDGKIIRLPFWKDGSLKR